MMTAQITLIAVLVMVCGVIIYETIKDNL